MLGPLLSMKHDINFACIMRWLDRPFQCEKGSKYGRPCVLAKYHQASKAKPLRPHYCIGRKLIKLDDTHYYFTRLILEKMGSL